MQIRTYNTFCRSAFSRLGGSSGVPAARPSRGLPTTRGQSGFHQAVPLKRTLAALLAESKQEPERGPAYHDMVRVRRNRALLRAGGHPRYWTPRPRPRPRSGSPRQSSVPISVQTNVAVGHQPYDPESAGTSSTHSSSPVNSCVRLLAVPLPQPCSSHPSYSGYFALSRISTLHAHFPVLFPTLHFHACLR